MIARKYFWNEIANQNELKELHRNYFENKLLKRLNKTKMAEK